MDYKQKTLNQLLAYEVAQIDDDEIRAFVIDTLDKIDPDHGTKPASSTGKYHPKCSNGEGGLIRHTKLVVKNVLEIVKATPAIAFEEDELIAAAILHDMWKYPVGRDHEFTAFDHPKLGGNYCKEHGFETIGRLIASHQGIWTTNKKMPGFENEQPRKFDEWCFHYADFFASRPYFQSDFDECGELIVDYAREEVMQEKKNEIPKRIIL